NSRLPWTSLMWPRTQVTIMCRTRNPAAVCPGSKIHLGMSAPSREKEQGFLLKTCAWRKITATPVPCRGERHGIGCIRNPALRRDAPRKARDEESAGLDHGLAGRRHVPRPPVAGAAAPPAAVGGTETATGRPELGRRRARCRRHPGCGEARNGPAHG